MLYFKKIKAHKVMDPVLAFGRQNTIHFYQLSETLSGKINFIPLQKAELGFELLNFGWLNTRCMCLLDSTETFHLYDVRNQETLESIELTDAQLVYGSPFFKGMIISLEYNKGPFTNYFNKKLETFCYLPTRTSSCKRSL